MTRCRLVDSSKCFEVACVEFSEYSSILRMESAGSSKTWRPLYQISRYHVSEYRHLQHGPTACHKKLHYVSGLSFQLRTSQIIFHTKSSGKFSLIKFFISTSSPIIPSLPKLRKLALMYFLRRNLEVNFRRDLLLNCWPGQSTLTCP